ncbi:FAD-dependent oxidoreductase [Nonomuraea longicatena]|uniref:Amine oxidase domain-containing protein n=1 Tax=Nonomuraea longicatena TaxID=83682 RepID=A0ABN1PLT9_9ACTN
MGSAARTAIIGGGMAGCAAARELVRSGREVTIFETGEGLGGRARSWHRPEIEPTVGINLMYVSFYPLMTRLVEEYGLKDQLVRISSDVYISDGGNAVPLSSDSPLNILKYPLASLRDRLGFAFAGLQQVRRRDRLDLFDPLKAAPFDDGSSIADFAHRYMSPRGFDFLLRPQVEGFWNFRCEDVSSVHGRALLAWLGGSTFQVFRDGMQVLAERLTEGAEHRLGHEVTDLQLTGEGVRVIARTPSGDPVGTVVDDVVVATPAPIAAKLTATLPGDVVGGETRTFLETQEYEPAISFAYLVEPGGLPAGAHIVAGGSADPPIRNMITYPRKVRDGDGRLTDRLLVFAYPGRALTRRLLGAAPQEQFAAVTPLLKTLWRDFPADCEPFHVVERPFGFPIPAPGRYRSSARVTRGLRPPVVFAGDYFNSPTTEAALLSGVRAANALLTA